MRSRRRNPHRQTSLAHKHRSGTDAGSVSHQVKPLSIACPQCEQPPQFPCVNADGYVIATVHIVRRRMATRAFNAAREAEAANPAGRVMKGPACICPDCQVKVRLVVAGFSDRELGITRKTLIIHNHTPGGGLYSVMKGDVLCLGSGKAVPPLDGTAS